MQRLKQSLLRAAGLIFIMATGLSSAARADPAAKTPAPLDKLVFDAETKQYDSKLGELSAPFVFNVTNTWTNEITIDRVETSCGCTVASLPSNPWHLPSGGSGEVKAAVNLEGKAPGLIAKTLTLFVSAGGNYLGRRMVTVKVTIPEVPLPAALTEAQRKAAMAQAKSDPQKIFKDPACAECHVKRGLNTSVDKLYAADCGICHDSPNRASSVPDLHALKVPTSFAYWKSIIANGKPHTMMPPFADTKGGPLTDEQVHSLAEYLDRAIKSASAAAQ